MSSEEIRNVIDFLVSSIIQITVYN